MTTSAEAVIAKLGGTRKASSILNFPPSTIQSWKRAGFIPAKHQSDVMAKAAAAGVKITPADIIVSKEATQ